MRRTTRIAGATRLGLRLAAGRLLQRRVPIGLDGRLAMVPRDGLPLRSPVDLAWNAHQVPRIEAAHDRDLAVALGVVHVHLRHAQLEIMRAIAYGRLSEALGAVAFDIDHTLRIVDFPRAVPAIAGSLPDRTAEWLDGFVAGTNAAIDRAETLPEEFRLLGLEPKPWTMEDVLAVGRLAAMDFSWRVWHRLMHLRERPDWTDLWRRIVDSQASPVPHLAGGPGEDVAAWLAGAFGRTGSNAAAVSATRSESGGALLTSDPHLSIMMPNTWLAAVLVSPGYRVSGIMIPGLPVLALGRNPWIGWGGTSLHAASSDLFDVGDLPAGAVRARSETIRIRWSQPRTVTLRDTDHGPVISDAPLLRTGGRQLALAWIGHRPSDEVSAMLGMMRARDWTEFNAAIDGFAGPAQNLVFADREGRVGHAMAAHLPARGHGRPEDMVSHATRLDDWQRIVTARDLPKRFEPAEGFVASANNRPGQTPVPVGFFFSPNERVDRLRQCLGNGGTVSREDLRALHRDVVMPSSSAMRDILADLVARAVPQPDQRHRAVLQALQAWDGAHDEDSPGALAFELVLAFFLERLHGTSGIALYRASLQPWILLREDLAAIAPGRIEAAARDALWAAAEPFAEFRTWGAMHRLRIAHPFAAFPLIGKRYVMADLPVGGSNETLMKTAHGLSTGRHNVGFGANARFLADFADEDETYALLLGGQDGWLGSSTADDQLALWREGRLMPMPLGDAAGRAAFPYRTPLAPADADV